MHVEYNTARSVTRFKLLTIFGCLGTLAFLLAEAWRENVGGDLRRHQEAYAAKLSPELRAGFEVGVKQAFVADLDRVDRCQSCHVGIDDPSMGAEEQPLTAHPGELLAAHPPSVFGCTICHQGQGRALTVDAAHGEVAHWEEPLLRGEIVYASCGQCHPEVGLYANEAEFFGAGLAGTEIHSGDLYASLEGAEILARGKQLVRGSGCLGCHTYRGRGGTLGPELTHIGDKGLHGYDYSHLPDGVSRTPLSWLTEHFMDPGALSPGTVMPDTGSSAEEAQAMAAYMLALRSQDVPARYRPAPSFEAGSAANGQELYELFCVACHGPELSGSEVPGIRTPSLSNADLLSVANQSYMGSLIERGRSNTQMPAWDLAHGGLTGSQIDRLVDYIFSKRERRAVLADVSSQSGDARMGRALYRGNCASCHGVRGEGGIGTRLNSADFLAMSSDAFLARTLIEGRRETGMPSWAHLGTQDLSDVLAYLRTWGDQGVELDEVADYLAAGAADPEIGARLYTAHCADCHGPEGAGSIGPSLNNDNFLSLVPDEYLAAAILEGRPGTAMPAWRGLAARDVGDLVTHLRGFSELGYSPPDAEIAHGDPDHGALLFERTCVSCHGDQAVGGTGPQLRNPRFLAHADDDFLYQTIAGGRPGTAMRGFLKGSGSGAERSPGAAGVVEYSTSQIADIVAWLRQLEHAPPTEVTARHVLGSPVRGRLVYEETGSCAQCHGHHGEGGVGPAIGNPDFLAAAGEGYLLGTMVLGREGTPMRSFTSAGISKLTPEELMDVSAYITTLADNRPEGRAGWRTYAVTEDQIRYGELLFEFNCAACHGVDGRGGYAPELNNPEFLDVASDGYLAATIALGRSGTPMRSFGHGPASLVPLEHGEIRAIVGYIRSWEAAPADRAVTLISAHTDSQEETPSGGTR